MFPSRSAKWSPIRGEIIDEDAVGVMIRHETPGATPRPTTSIIPWASIDRIEIMPSDADLDADLDNPDVRRELFMTGLVPRSEIAEHEADRRAAQRAEIFAERASK